MDKIPTKKSLASLATVINNKIQQYGLPVINITVFTPSSLDPMTKSAFASTLGVTEDDVDVITSGRCILKNTNNDIYYCDRLNASGGVVSYTCTAFDWDYVRLELRNIFLYFNNDQYIMLPSKAHVDMVSDT